MIAQGAQFNVPDPVAQYNKLAQMQKYQQENELAKMQMEEYGRARQESNALRQFLPGLNESNRSQLLGYGAAGQGVYKTLAEGDTQQRLRDQARSQADLNESSILKNAVAQTRDAVAGIDPNDVESYAALRTSVLTQYPKLEPYMPAAWDANVKQRLITTAASVLEGQKPNIAPIDVSKFTPESLQAYLNSKNPASLVAIAPKPVNPYAPIDPSKYTQDSLKAYGLSGQVSDLVPLPTKAANAFAPINVKDFTPESVKAFVASQNLADLVAAPSKATNPFAPINVKDYTSESLEAYGLSGKVSDLVPVPTKQKSNIANIDPSKFTVASVAKYDTSGNYADLEPIAAKPERLQNLVNPIDASKFTAPSVSAYSSSGGDYSLLVPVVSATKADRTIANIDPAKYTSASVEKYSVSGNYGDLKLLPEKAGGGGTTVPKAPSGYRFNKSGDLEPIPGGPAAGKPLTALQQQALKKDFAADTSKIKSSVDTADELEKLTDELVGNPDKKIKPHPGLGGITGYAGLLPSFAESPVTSGNAAKAEQKLETFKGKIKTLGRSLASLDGKLGNMAVQEWQMVSDSVQAIKPTAGNLEEQMRDVVRQARLLAKNLRDKFDLTYEDTTPAAAPGRPAVAALAPADKQALDWANANPKDPRSPQIKQRLGQ